MCTTFRLLKFFPIATAATVELTVVEERKFRHRKSVPSHNSQNRNPFCAGRFWQCRALTMPVLSARLHKSNICCERSPKILSPSINIYCFLWVSNSKQKVAALYPVSLEVCECQRYGTHRACELQYVGPERKEVRYKEVWAIVPYYYFYPSSGTVVTILTAFFYSASTAFASCMVHTNSSNIHRFSHHTSQTLLLVHCIAVGI